MAEASALERGRAAYQSRTWLAAHRLLTEADQSGQLTTDDLSLLAHASYLSGNADDCIEVLGRAYHLHVHEGAVDRAAGCAYWLAFALLGRGEHAQANGWVSRAMTMLDEDGRDCVERGYLDMLSGIQTLMQGDAAGALEAIEKVAPIARRYADPDLLGLFGLGRGQALIALDRTEEGLDQLDEVMVSATRGELTETVAGLAYCAIIATCHEIFDVRRAREWTDALSRWCANQPDLVPYSGHCLVHRAEIHQLHGNWSDAADAAREAHERYVIARDWGSEGLAFYQEGELHRLRGEYDKSEASYLEASRRGHDPQPGTALLRLAQGRADQAATHTRRLVQEPLDRLRRARALAVHVEVMLATGDIEEARVASAELTETASRFAPSMLRAVAQQAAGSVEVASGDPASALGSLRGSVELWRELDAPYELARARELVGQACLALGDADAAASELTAAADTYGVLGARADLERVRGGGRTGAGATTPGGLTSREIEVLRLVAAGKTNRAIAAELVLSEKTVARHVSNIFTKLDVPSRAAATAFAYENKLV